MGLSRSSPTRFALVTALLAAPTAATAQHLQRASPLFELHNGFWNNLHHFLYVTARARSGLDASRPAVTDALRDTAGFGALAPGMRASWNSAVAFYQRDLARRDILFDSSLVLTSDRIAMIDDATPIRTAAIDRALAVVLEHAAPAYRELWWPRHSAANARWIADTRRLLAEYGDSAAALEVRLFRHRWPSPVRVDVAAYTNWAGAYTTDEPPHINVSSLRSEISGASAFETLFHEVLHAMDATLFDSLRVAYERAGKPLMRDPTHPFIFYTAGEVARRFFPGYVPYAMANGLWARVPDYARILPLLREYWQPYVQGHIALGDALGAIAAHW
ncbi:MAG: hypothetical protein ACHQWU_13695 [Gemmatimonadales bacterium]